MQEKNSIYLSLGSNVGDRINNLQQAINRIFETIGDVVSISSVYKTASWGFESDYFYNICIKIDTFYATREVLNQLLVIEESLGRIRTVSQGYQARTIDLDVILSSEGVIDKEDLKVPHPAMPDRIFVLKPLADIAGDVIHDQLQVSVKELLVRTTDNSEIQRLDHQLHNPKENYNLSKFSFRFNIFFFSDSSKEF